MMKTRWPLLVLIMSALAACGSSSGPYAAAYKRKGFVVLYPFSRDANAEEMALLATSLRLETRVHEKIRREELVEMSGSYHLSADPAGATCASVDEFSLTTQHYGLFVDGCGVMDMNNVHKTRNGQTEEKHETFAKMIRSHALDENKQAVIKTVVTTIIDGDEDHPDVPDIPRDPDAKPDDFSDLASYQSVICWGSYRSMFDSESIEYGVAVSGDEHYLIAHASDVKTGFEFCDNGLQILVETSAVFEFRFRLLEDKDKTKVYVPDAGHYYSMKMARSRPRYSAEDDLDYLEKPVLLEEFESCYRCSLAELGKYEGSPAASGQWASF